MPRALVVVPALLALSAAAYAKDDREEGVRATRVYLGGGNAFVNGGSYGAGELGVERYAVDGHLAKTAGLGLIGVSPNDSLTVPLWGLHGTLQWLPFTGALEPYVGGGLGLDFLLILPFPSVSLDLGAALKLGPKLYVDARLSARAIVEWNGDTANVNTLDLGLAF